MIILLVQDSAPAAAVNLMPVLSNQQVAFWGLMAAAVAAAAGIAGAAVTGWVGRRQLHAARRAEATNERPKFSASFNSETLKIGLAADQFEVLGDSGQPLAMRFANIGRGPAQEIGIYAEVRIHPSHADFMAEMFAQGRYLKLGMFDDGPLLAQATLEEVRLFKEGSSSTGGVFSRWGLKDVGEHHEKATAAGTDVDWAMPEALVRAWAFALAAGAEAYLNISIRCQSFSGRIYDSQVQFALLGRQASLSDGCLRTTAEVMDIAAAAIDLDQRRREFRASRERRIDFAKRVSRAAKRVAAR